MQFLSGREFIVLPKTNENFDFHICYSMNFFTENISFHIFFFLPLKDVFNDNILWKWFLHWLFLFLHSLFLHFWQRHYFCLWILAEIYSLTNRTKSTICSENFPIDIYSTWFHYQYIIILSPDKKLKQNLRFTVFLFFENY